MQKHQLIKKIDELVSRNFDLQSVITEISYWITDNENKEKPDFKSLKQLLYK